MKKKDFIIEWKCGKIEIKVKLPLVRFSFIPTEG